MIPLLPSLILLGLVMSRWWISDLQTPLASALWGFTAALLCLFLFLHKRRAFVLPWDLRVGLTLAALALGSLLWSVDRGETLLAAVPMLTVVLLAVACRLWLQPTALAWALLFGAAGASLVALRQVWVALPALQDMVRSGEIVVDATTRNNIMAGRAFATFYAPDMLGGALAGALMIGLGLVGAQRGWRRGAALFLSLLIGLGLISSQSVGAALALLIALLPLALGLLRHRRSLIAGCALLIGVGLAASWTALPRLQKISYRAQARLKDQRLAVETGLDAPLFGHGHNTFASAPWSRRRHKHPLTRYAHGWLGQSFADLGVAGLSLTAWLLLIWLGHGLGAVRRRGEAQDWLLLGAISGLAACLIHGLLDYDLMFGENQAVLWICAVLSSPISSSHPFHAQGRRRWSLLALAALCVALAGWQSAGRLAEHEDKDETQDCVRQIAVLQGVASWAPPLSSRYTALATAIAHCQALGPDRLRQSILWQQQAVNTSSLDAVLRSDLALLLAQAGDRERAKQQIKRAWKQWPMVGHVYLRWAQIAWFDGDIDRARALARRALLLDRATPEIAREAGVLLSATP